MFFNRNNLAPLLTPQMRKIGAVAILAFACLAATLYVVMRCFKGNKLNKVPQFDSEDFKKLDESPKTSAEEFKEKEIEFKQKFDQAKTLSEKLLICDEFSMAINKFQSQSFQYKSPDKAIIEAAAKLRIDMIMEMNQIDFSTEELNLVQKETLKFNKALIETIIKTDETIEAKSKAAAQAAENRKKLFDRSILNDPFDTELKPDRRRETQKCIELQEAFQMTFEALMEELDTKFEGFITNTEISDCSERIYSNMKGRLYTLANASLELGVSYCIT